MKEYSSEWFSKGISLINEDENALKYFQHINSIFQFKVDGSTFTFYGFDHKVQNVTDKKVYHNVDFTLEGSKEAWQKLLKGEIGITQGLSPLYQKLSLTGSPILFQANLYFVIHLIKLLNQKLS
ncbi:SCP2 sterol-binding domain-containing protein [Neobacillus niacini]|uniref:SCP2 sterol-binding domain-containing protein n=1 Tax=Neobacillus niacini TaxID=86668 RepID=UPI00203F2D1D|nr:SCP2 sterol-binding domain-containing protein [Neobacillus niacini]